MRGRRGQDEVAEVTYQVGEHPLNGGGEPMILSRGAVVSGLDLWMPALKVGEGSREVRTSLAWLPHGEAGAGPGERGGRLGMVAMATRGGYGTCVLQMEGSALASCAVDLMTSHILKKNDP